MDERYYQERAARRNRILVAGGLLVALVACGAVVGLNLFRDTCTGSFDRAPAAVISSFVQALQRSDMAGAQECWAHDAYYDLSAGCSEICLQRAAGVAYTSTNVAVERPVEAAGRAQIKGTVSVGCPDGSSETGEITLDGIANDVPWRHWKIVRSSVGGGVAEQWCK